MPEQPQEARPDGSQGVTEARVREIVREELARPATGEGLSEEALRQIRQQVYGLCGASPD